MLGGAAAGGNTGQGCSGYLVETSEMRIVLDLGPGTLPELRRHADFRTLDAIVLSHLHLDHVLDVGALRFALAYNPIKAPRPIPLWLPPGGLNFLRRFGAAFAEPGGENEFFLDTFTPREYDPTETLTIGKVALRFAPTVHYVPCWAIRLSESGVAADLGYTADAGPASDLKGLLQDVSVLVAEANWLDEPAQPVQERGHLTAREAAHLATAVGAETLVLTHLWEENEVDAVRAAAMSAFSGRIELAHPGLEIEW